MVNINRLGKLLSIFVILAMFANIVFAGGTLANALRNFCQQAKLVLVAAVALLIVLAAVVYAIGQVLGAETRARASVWATAMVTGAIIGIILFLVTPAIVNSLLAGSSVSTLINGVC